MKKIGAVVFFLFFVVWTGFSQSSRQSLRVWTGTSPFHLDSLQYLPSSLQIDLDTNFYRLKTGKIEWLGPPQWATISYRPIPDFLLKSTSLGIGNTNFSKPAPTPYIYRPEKSKNLDYQGSFMRNLSLGNRQDLVLQSGFNMQINGTIGDGIQLRAALTDENLPIQPMGNTRQLKEFDRLFIELSKKNQRFTIGDFEVFEKKSAYSTFHKKVQGLEYQGSTEISENTHLIYRSSVSMARGQQARIQLEQKEGNQGPYPLTGSQGEKFIIVIAGTEKVFINGVRMERGMDADYIIDYNSGEITFTGKRMITKDSRILVEFEYTTQTHQSSFIHAYATLQKEKSAFSVQLISQQDTKNPPGGIPYTMSEIETMANAGDRPISLKSAIPFLGFDPQRPLYTRIDTLLPCGKTDTIYRLSGPTEGPLFSVRFTYVGEGEGNYISDGEQNFEWVSPDPENCSPRGNYSPFIPLQPPQSHRILNFSGYQNIGKSWKFHGEVAMSKKDLNRFSNLDEQNDQGIAGNFSLENETDWGLWKLKGGLKYERISQNFESLLPFRHPEFYRDWGLTDINGRRELLNSDEHLTQAHLHIERKEIASLRYRVSSFSRTIQNFEALQHGGNFNFSRKGWELEGGFEEVLRGTEKFSKPKFQIQKNNSLGSLTAFYLKEKNSFLENPYSIEEYGLKISTHEGKAFSAGAEWKQRIDGWKANEMAVKAGWTGHKNIKLEGMLTHRKLETSHFLGRMDAKINLLKNGVVSHTHYEVGSGQTPLIQFTFLKVRKGEGTHIWLDSLYNSDGVIQPHEMEMAPFQDQADYVRVHVQSRDFIPTRYVQWNQTLRLQPAAILGGKTIWSRFSAQSNVRIHKNIIHGQGSSIWNPFEYSISDTSMIGLDASFRHILFYRPIESLWESQLGKSGNQRKIVMGTGFEANAQKTYWWINRIKLHSSVLVSIEIKSTSRNRDSEFFKNKNFELRGWEAIPEIHWMPKNELKLEGRFMLKKEGNLEGDGQEFIFQKGGNFSFTYHTSENSRLTIGGSAIQVNFEGEANSPLGFALLNGMGKGLNLLWNISLDRQLSETLRLNLHYEGRKTGIGSPVHIGRAGILAIF